MSWRDLLVIIRQSPAGSAVERALNPEDAQWGLTEHLLRLAVDALHVANWQRQGDEKAPYPQPIPGPGERPMTPEMAAEQMRRVDETLRKRTGRAPSDGRG